MKYDLTSTHACGRFRLHWRWGINLAQVEGEEGDFDAEYE